jgi:hypothetical protein
MNADEILERATKGELSAPEQDAVAEALRSGSASFDRYTLLLALGRAMGKKHRAVVEAFLQEKSDPMLARLALQILCKFWSETERYVSVVERAIVGLDWDHDDDIRQMATSIAGEYLRDERNPALLKELLAIVDDESEEEFTRKDAYVSLARAMGLEWEELPPLSRLPPLAELQDMRLMEAARARLAKELA